MIDLLLIRDCNIGHLFSILVNLLAAFEHHTHHRKFTFKIKGNQPQSNTTEGVRYVGDGSWGVP
jgi:hypothetical protein